MRNPRGIISTNVHDVDASTFEISIRQYSDFGALEIAIDGHAVNYFVDGADAGWTLRNALTVALTASDVKYV